MPHRGYDEDYDRHYQDDREYYGGGRRSRDIKHEAYDDQYYNKLKNDFIHDFTAGKLVMLFLVLGR